MKSTFENCLWEDLEQIFGLQRTENHVALDALFSNGYEIPADKQQQLLTINATLRQSFLDWNEDELKMQFIAPLLYLVNYDDSPHYHAFSQRPLSIKTDHIELSGVVDWMLASGKQLPRYPYFFLHEYKREKAGSNDPLGQLLAAMITAQFLNKAPNQTIYGCYIIGKDWYFVILHQQVYAVSIPLNATDINVLSVIYKVLVQVKKAILTSDPLSR